MWNNISTKWTWHMHTLKKEYSQMKIFFFFTPHALTPGDPTWNPCTIMRTVSPTLALVGDIKSLGPFGAAEKRKKEWQKDKGHCTSVESKSCRIPVLSQRERDKYNFLSIKVTGREARDLPVLSSTGLCRIYSPLEWKKTKLGRYSLREENWSAPGGVWRQWDKGHSES